MSQGEPFGALQTPAIHELEGQSASTPHGEQVMPLHSLLAHSALSPQLLPFGARQMPARQVLLAQSPFAAQTWPVVFRQEPAPSHAIVGSVQVPRSMSPTGTREQTPTDPGRLHAMHVPVHVVVQHVVSTHERAAVQSLFAAQTAPVQPPQVPPPQSMAVSVPFFRTSEQLMQVCAVRSHVGFTPPVQSASAMQLKHLPASSHLPFGHEVPIATGVFVGTPPTQSFCVQTFMSSGVSFGSTSIAGFPSAPHTLFMQLPGVCVIDSSPLVSFGAQNDRTQIDAVQPSNVGIPQSTSPTHGVHPVPIQQLPVLVLSLVPVVMVLEVDALTPPVETPARSSVQPLGASVATLASTSVTPTPSARDPRPAR